MRIAGPPNNAPSFVMCGHGFDQEAGRPASRVLGSSCNLGFYKFVQSLCPWVRA